MLLLLHLSLCPLHVYRFYTVDGAKRLYCTVCVARLGFSTVYVTLCLRYSMYWFPRYNVSFRQHFCMRQGQGQGQDHTRDRDRGQGHLSNSDEDGGITRRRVPRRTSSEIASAKIAGRPIPVKVSQGLCGSNKTIENYLILWRFLMLEKQLRWPMLASQKCRTSGLETVSYRA